MGALKRRGSAIVVLVVIACTALAVSLAPASAFDPNGNVYHFNYNVDAAAHMKTLDQTIVVKGGKFIGGIDFGTAELRGKITLPPSTFTFKLGGLLPLVDATARIIPTKLVTGTVDLNTLTVTATSVFNVQLVSVYISGTKAPNLVGNGCITATPASVTMSGTASLGETSTFSGDFTMPPFKDCGKKTAVLNLVLSGPGNTFTATATPAE